MNMTDISETLSAKGPTAIPREEFEHFLGALTHEIRNRLNGIALEAADLAEQAGPPADAMRLHQHVQNCSAFLKKVRETWAPDDSHAEKVPLSDFAKKLRERHAHEEESV